MIEISGLLTQGWFIFLLSTILSLAIFPLVIVFSFVYEKLETKYSKTPKVLLMLICTFLATLVLVVILEFYFGSTLAQLTSVG